MAYQYRGNGRGNGRGGHRGGGHRGRGGQASFPNPENMLYRDLVDTRRKYELEKHRSDEALLLIEQLRVDVADGRARLGIADNELVTFRQEAIVGQAARQELEQGLREETAKREDQEDTTKALQDELLVVHRGLVLSQARLIEMHQEKEANDKLDMERRFLIRRAERSSKAMQETTEKLREVRAGGRLLLSMLDDPDRDRQVVPSRDCRDLYTLFAETNGSVSDSDVFSEYEDGTVGSHRGDLSGDRLDAEGDDEVGDTGETTAKTIPNPVVDIL